MSGCGELVQILDVADKNTEQQVRQEMAEKLRESFDTLAMGATAKNNTIESLIKTIIELTSNNSDLTATIKKLTNQLERDPSKNRQSDNIVTININVGKWPSWCAPDAYCFTCVYKLRKGHNSGNCNRGKSNPNHKKQAILKDAMGSSKMNAGFGNAPNGK